MGDTTAANGVTATSGPGPAVTQPGASDRERVKQMAQEFEALLMTQMLREMRRAMLPDEEDGQTNGLGNDTMTDTLDIELGRALSRSGGFGLAGVLSSAIQQRLGAAPGSVPAGAAPSMPPLVEPAASVAPPAVGSADASGQMPLLTDEHELQLPKGAVSSAFGWRADPFTRAPQFHRGIDVAQAYGRDVHAAAAGHVVFSGEQGAYGTMVVIDHPGHRQTRYAHLSATSVRPGDIVDTGQVIGKSGDSGRSTGPHLHFEVLDAGRPVDPSGT
jgi:murein DD-endopeptidase MepM/ murein hydrolase activator NlpD